jgi:hypothetical protein
MNGKFRAAKALRFAPPVPCTTYDLLSAIGNLSVATGEESEAHIEMMVGLLIDGLRYRAGKAPADQ